MPKIIECVPNFSEGINEKVISAISGLVFVGFSLIRLIIPCKLAGLINHTILTYKVNVCRHEGFAKKRIQNKIMAKETVKWILISRKRLKINELKRFP